MTALASATAKFYSQLKALTNRLMAKKKLAGIVIQNCVKKPKMTIFRHLKCMFETWADLLLAR
jgi:hypothetical protein